MVMVSLWSLMVSLSVVSLLAVARGHAGSRHLDEVTLNCHRREYTYPVVQSDAQGRTCRDTVAVKSCWGRCDSNEISDWRFPYKRSYHPVCLHDAFEDTTAVLKYCDEGAEPGTELYRLRQALTCRCLVCKSSVASCEGLRTWTISEAEGLAGREA